MTGNLQQHDIQGEFVELSGESFYKISNVDKMPAFLISLVSGSDHWFYISSSGCLSVGRVKPEIALFPYRSDDCIHENAENTGSKTIIRVQNGGSTLLWEPFTPHQGCRYNIKRNLYKNTIGNKLIFEEINADLGLVFSYCWATSDQHGFIRHSSLKTLPQTQNSVKVELLDGLQNLLPADIPRILQQDRSALCDAYKWNEQVGPNGLTCFNMYAQLSDRAEPAESLRCTVAYYLGCQPTSILVSSEQLTAFRNGEPPHNEPLKRGVRCSYLLHLTFEFQHPGQEENWTIITDVEQTQLQVAELMEQLRNEDQFIEVVDTSIAKNGQELLKLMAASDAIQQTAEQATTVHHYANVLFNNMRGGAIENNYQIQTHDFIASTQQLNRAVISYHQNFLQGLPDTMNYQDLVSRVRKLGDPQFTRLTMEYLPITFGRRHGDPSRPWNHFEIKVKAADGSRLLNYQGNWRDIFQNWEALAISYPGFIPSFITKFVNASTVDGYNPYRITKQGIDWEVVEEDDPWSNIGYWGDHQIIYLLKFLEWAYAYQPDMMQHMLHDSIYAYANVPYRIKPYSQLLDDAKDTVEFDSAAAERIEQLVTSLGADGKLVMGSDGEVYLCNLMEKLLVPYLAKFGNFVADGGIWLNTQRPEWNDANNAIVGNGLSMVTLYYMNRYTKFLSQLLAGEQGSIAVSQEVATWLKKTHNSLATESGKPLDDMGRKQLLNSLGQSAGEYRATVYQHGFSGQTDVAFTELKEFLTICQAWLQKSITANLRHDGLYNAYNIGLHHQDTLQIDTLYPMLEGQVAALSSGALKVDEALALLDTLYSSSMYRADQNSFMLYPDRELPGFMKKNCIALSSVAQCKWLSQMIEGGDFRIINRDAQGCYRFNPDFANSKFLERALQTVIQDYPARDDAAAYIRSVLDCYENVFNHKAFTGRSGTMFAYEGLGSIYWHMVSKLLLAVQEIYQQAQDEQCDAVTIAALARYYYRIREGIGFNKTPQNYGAFPCDPYSHTPGHAGARQPGMTGQVKEEIITRWGELGLRIKGGQLQINPQLLREQEFTSSHSEFRYFDVDGTAQQLSLKPGSLAFTWCQVPFVYTVNNETDASLLIYLHTGEVVASSLKLSTELSQSLFNRSGQIERVELIWPRSYLNQFV